MSDNRITAWIALACLGNLAACTSGDTGKTGGTELNVIVPNGAIGGGSSAPSLIDLQSVEYTIDCAGNSDTFLDNSSSFPDEVTLNGNLEVQDGRTNLGAIYGDPALDGNAEIWQGFMDLPPGPCTIQLRARDDDGEVICTATEPFTIAADSTSKVNIVLICDIAFQAPVGMLDVDGTFSFNVGNFCPDIFILNALDSAPAANATEVQVRGRDGDDGCGLNCDPQSCVPSPTGLSCTPGPDPGLSITLTTTSGSFDCDQDSVIDGTSCVFLGDQLDTGNVDFICDGGVPPGTVVTITALITDGDLDCDKTKQIQITCGNGPGVCGDGYVNTGEACDGDGTGTGGETATCDSDCTAAICGDGTQNVTAGELCDDGNTVGGDGCPASCGPPACGDGSIDAPEACDDGNVSSGDGCASTCVIETGYNCTGQPSSCASTCGDGVVASDEACDDGNTVSGDGCDAVCVVESGYTCTGSPSTCSTTCGDGIIAGAEACDDGNVAGSDGCSAVCTIELGWGCTGEPSSCSTTCGDGIPAGSETCDDGNTVGGDGCSATCQLEGCGNFVLDVGEDCDEGGVETATCDADCSNPTCGDGDVNALAGEACDDSNTLNGDGCSSVCAVESGYGCTGEPSTCSTTCGDGIVAGAEACDDGGTSGGDGCSASCTVETGYGCTGSPSSCSPVCGDGLILGGEACDDGNASGGDGCSAVCQVETGYGCTGQPSSCDTICGDSIPVGTEQCDDGNFNYGDGCRPDCTSELCGDGIVDPGEQCDGGPNCSGTCTLIGCQMGGNNCQNFNDGFSFGRNCQTYSLCIGSPGYYLLQGTTNGTSLNDYDIIGQAHNLNDIETAQTRTDYNFLPAGNYTVEACDNTGAGISTSQVCVLPADRVSAPGVVSGTVSDSPDLDGGTGEIDLAGPISGGDQCYVVDVVTTGNYRIVANHNSGGGLLAAGLYSGTPPSGLMTAAGQSPSPIAVGGQGTSSYVTLTAGTAYHLCADTATLGSSVNFTLTLEAQ